MLKKLRQRNLQADDSALVMIIGVIIMMLLAIWLISAIASAIIPLAIFLILAIVLVVIVKKMLFGGRSLGIIRALSGAGREAGRETVGLMKGAGREYEQYRKRKEAK